MSWKDRTLLGDIPALKEAGVTCAVIGSRERRVEYVAAYTAEARNALEDGQKPADADRDTMERVFAPYGVAKRRVYERAEPHEEEPRAVERYCAALRRSYSDTEIRRVGVRFAVVAQSGENPITLGAQDYDGHQTVLRGPYPDPVGDTELTEDSLKEIMYRTAGTPFRCEEVETALGEGLRVSGIELDEARRRLLYALSEQRAAVPAREEGLFPAEPFRSVPAVVPAINFSVQNAEQLTPELAALRPAALYVPLEVLWRHGEKLRPFLDEGCAVAAALPAVACGEEECGDLRRMLAEVRESGVAEALTGNLGLALIASQEGYELRGDLDLIHLRRALARAVSRPDRGHEQADPGGSRDLRPSAGHDIRNLHHKGKRRPLLLHHARPDGGHPRRRLARNKGFRLPQYGMDGKEAVAGGPYGRVDPLRTVGGAAQLFHREPAGMCGCGRGLYPRRGLPA